MCKRALLFSLMVMLTLGIVAQADVDDQFAGGGTSNEIIAPNQSSSAGLVLHPDNWAGTFSWGGYSTSDDNPSRYRTDKIHRFAVQSYFLTVFDSAGGNLADTITTVTAITLTVGNNNEIRHLVRDACSGTWYASDEVSMGIDGSGYALDVTSVNWVLLPESDTINATIANSTATFPSALTFSGTPGPVPAKIDGGGLYHVVGAPEIRGFLWSGVDAGCGELPPSVNAGVYPATIHRFLDTPFELSGVVLDADPGTIKWTQSSVGGGTATFDPVDANVVDPAVIFDAADTYTLTLSASNATGSSSSSVEITVVDNYGPTALAGEDQVVYLSEGGTLTLAGEADDDGYPASLTTVWSVESGPEGAIVNFDPPDGSALDATVEFTEPGDYVLKLTVSDGLENDSSTMRVKVWAKPYEQLDITPEEDTYLYQRAGNHRKSNMGGSDILKVIADDLGAEDDDARIGRAIFRFDLNQVPGAIKGATLSMKAKTVPATTDPSDMLEAKALTYTDLGEWLNGTDDTWGSIDDDPLLNWNNQYEWLVYGDVLDSQAPPADEQRVEFAVDDFVVEEGNKANLAVTMTSELEGANGREYNYGSDEAGEEDRPFLTLFYDPNEAYGPTPADGAVEVHPAALLSWFKGAAGAAENTLYLGTDPDPFTNPVITKLITVNPADPNAVVYDPSPDFPGGLAVGTTYHWGIKGDNGQVDSRIWSFTVMAVHPDVPINVSPADGTADLVIPDDIVFEWTEGDNAVSYDLYIGTDRTAVENGTSVKVFDVATPYDPNGMLLFDLETEIFWRVEAFGPGGPWTSEITSFATGNYEVVDDFEDGVWPGGLVETIVRNQGAQAMRIDYTAGSPASATKTFVGLQDWSSRTGREAIRIHLHGTETNVTEDVYVEITGGGITARVSYDAPADLIQESYRNYLTWHVDMDAFTNVDLTSVESITIGVDTPNGDGALLVDNIRAYATRCVSALVGADIVDDGDCEINLNDVSMLVQDWLKSSGTVTAEPLAGDPVAQFALDAIVDPNATVEGDEYIQDSIGAATASIVGTPTVVFNAERGGDVMSFDGGDQFALNNPVGVFNGAVDVTVTMWIRGDETVIVPSPTNGKLPQLNLVMGKSSDSGTFLRSRYPNTSGQVTIGGNLYGAGASRNVDPLLFKGQWNHYALVLDATGQDVGLYINGIKYTGKTKPDAVGPFPSATITEWNIPSAARGLISDYRIYDRALGQGEIVTLSPLQRERALPLSRLCSRSRTSTATDRSTWETLPESLSCGSMWFCGRSSVFDGL